MALPAHLGLVVIGAEGALALGGLAATIGALAMSGAPPAIVLLVMAIAGMIAGGAWVALADCIGWMKTREMFKAQGNAEVLRDHIAAVSCGVYNNTAVLDLDYAEDSEAETDANFVMTGAGNIVEIQATAEKIPFSEDQVLALLALARKGVAKLVELQKMAVP